MENDNAIRHYCKHADWCYTCFKEDPQDPVKLYLSLCHICDKDHWYSVVRLRISKDDLIRQLQVAPKEWIPLYQQELKARS